MLSLSPHWSPDTDAYGGGPNVTLTDTAQNIMAELVRRNPGYKQEDWASFYANLSTSSNRPLMPNNSGSQNATAVGLAIDATSRWVS